MPPSDVSHTLTGVALAASGWAMFSVQDAIVKFLVTTLPIPEVLFARSLVILALAGFLMRRGDFVVLARPGNIVATLSRGALAFAAWGAYYTASRSLQLAEMVTLYFAGPLFVVAMSRPFLGETVGAGRWSAVLVGFGGVLIAANPTSAPASWPVALTLFAALCWALTTLLARSLSRDVSTAAMMIGTNFVFFLLCGATGPALFVWPSARNLALMLLLGVVASAGQFLWFEGVRRAQASLLAPVEYSLLLWAILWGWLIFGDLPGRGTLAGAAIILCSGLLLLHVERRRQRVALRVARGGVSAFTP